MSLSPRSFTYVSELVRREAAIVLEPGKEYLVEARLQPLARAAGMPDLDAYVAHLQSAAGYPARAAVVESLTTNETSWFRDREPFDVLVSQVIPDLLVRNAARRKITVWSAACSSGQEAYTIAMLLSEHVRAAGMAGGDHRHRHLAQHGGAHPGGSLQPARDRPRAPGPLIVRHFQRAGTQWQVSTSCARWCAPR